MKSDIHPPPRLQQKGMINMGKEVYVDISARHVHLRPEDVETLFGPGVELTQRGQDNFMGGIVYAERVEVRGPKGSIPRVTILGPLRGYTQVEISATDARKIGVPAVIRHSGDHEGTPGCELVGPAGTLKMEKGVIVAHRHIHLRQVDADEVSVKAGDVVSIKISGTGRETIFGDVVVAQTNSSHTSVHIDTDEANAAGMPGAMMGELIVNG